jgi:hypothetical protein
MSDEAADAVDAAITEQMKEVVVLLEDHDLVPACAQMQILADQVNATCQEVRREQKLVNLRQRLKSGMMHVRQASRLTALIKFRTALWDWLNG